MKETLFDQSRRHDVLTMRNGELVSITACDTISDAVNCMMEKSREYPDATFDHASRHVRTNRKDRYSIFDAASRRRLYKEAWQQGYVYATLALCPDGVVRRAEYNSPDTWFSVPARVRVNGSAVYGFISANGADPDVLDNPITNPIVFHFYPYLIQPRESKQGDQS